MLVLQMTNAGVRRLDIRLAWTVATLCHVLCIARLLAVRESLAARATS